MKKKILVLCKDQQVGNLMKKLLATAEYESVVTTNIPATLGYIENDYFDLFITDRQLSAGACGSVLINQVKVLEPELRTILMSSEGKPEGFNADGFIKKPFDVEAMLKLIAEVLQK